MAGNQYQQPSRNAGYSFEFAASQHQYQAPSWDGRDPNSSLRSARSNNAGLPPRGVRSSQNLINPNSYSELSFVGRSSPATEPDIELHPTFHNYPPLPRPTYPQGHRTASISSGFTQSPQLAIANRLNSYLSDPNAPLSFISEVGTSPRKSSSPYFTSGGNIDYQNYRQGPGSLESTATGYVQSDSGYHTQPPAPQSVNSAIFSDFNPELPNLDSRFENYAPMPGSQPDNAQLETQSQEGLPSAPPSAPQSKPTRGGKKTCEQCKEVLKCPSDYKKHMLKHNKPHRCTISGCHREEGFSTVNDLIRHKKTVHKIFNSITKTFKCAAAGCKNADKIWPRLDNFKQHIERMHKGEDVKVLIERSEIKPNDMQNGGPSMDRDLVGTGAMASYNIPPVSNTIDPEDLRMPPAQVPPQYDATSRPYYQGSLSNGYPQNVEVCDGQRSSANPENHLLALADVAEVHIDMRAGQGQRLQHSSEMQPFGSSFVPVNDPNNPATHTYSQVMKVLEHANMPGSTRPEEEETARDMLTILKSRTAHHSMDGGSSDDQGKVIIGYPCTWMKGGKQCKAVFKRNCELKKHTARHTLPWGCTAPTCNHRSGSKADWIRHENVCTLAVDRWDSGDAIYICPYTSKDGSSNSNKCRYKHGNEKSFKAHLLEAHPSQLPKGKSGEVELDLLAQTRRLPSKRPGFGWCGFCVNIVEWDSKKKDKFSETFSDNRTDRYTHIDLHIRKNGKKFSDWVDLETQLMKDEDSGTTDLFNSQWYVDLKGKGIAERTAGRQKDGSGEDEVALNSMATLTMGLKRKRSPTESEYESECRRRLKKNTHATQWLCCNCDHGPMQRRLTDKCMNMECQHERCQKCDVTDDPYCIKGPYDRPRGYSLDSS